MPKVTKSSGNVFKDLGLNNPEELLAKASLAAHVYRIIKERRMTQTAAAQITGLKQPDISKLINGKFAGFSMDRLIELLNSLDHDVEIIIKPKPVKRESARVRVKAA